MRRGQCGWSGPRCLSGLCQVSKRRRSPSLPSTTSLCRALVHVPVGRPHRESDRPLWSCRYARPAGPRPSRLDDSRSTLTPAVPHGRQAWGCPSTGRALQRQRSVAVQSVPPPGCRAPVAGSAPWVGRCDSRSCRTISGTASGGPTVRTRAALFVRRYWPDVLCVQELVPETRAFLDDALHAHARVEDPFTGWATESNIWWRRDLFDYVEHGAAEFGCESYPNRRLFWVRLRPCSHPSSLVVSTVHLTDFGTAHELETGAVTKGRGSDTGSWRHSMTSSARKRRPSS